MTKQKQIVPFIVALSFFMESLDSTVLNTAIPSMAKSLQVNPIDLKMALISYLLSLAIFIPISGWLADKYGSRKVFIFATAVFTLSSLWCGFSKDLVGIVIARFIQGLGGALGLPVGRLIIIRTFGQQHLITQMNRIITVGAIGLMLGPYIGGFITTHFSWHWIFWMNIPIGLITIILSNYYLNNEEPNTVLPLDKIGFLLFGLSLCGATFSLSAFSESNIPPQYAWSILTISILFFILYCLHSHKKTHAVVKTDLFLYRTFRISILGNLFSRMGFGGIPFLLPLFLQIILKLSPETSGALLIPIAIGVLIAKQYSLRLLKLLGFKHLLISNTIFSGGCMMLFGVISTDSGFFLIMALAFLYGFMTSIQYSGMNALAFAEIPNEHLSAATSIAGTIQQLSQSIGVAVSALCLTYFSKKTILLTEKVFHHTFFCVGLLTIFSIIIFTKLKPGDGHQMIE